MWLFASYSRKDETAVEELIADLERAHLSVWHDQEIRGGYPWWQDILLRIRQCDVFLFALSKNSLASKPCLAELSYARTLGLPILPVLIGPVGNLRLTPVADIQVIDYRERTPAKGMAMLDAIHEAVTERRSLPAPLPEPPPVPYEYLLRLGSAIGAAQLTPDQQGDFIRQCREVLETEEDEVVKNDVLELLRALRRRPDITFRCAAAVDRLLADLSATDTRESHLIEAARDHSRPADTPVAAADGRAADRESYAGDRAAERRRSRRRATGSTAVTPGRGTWTRPRARLLVSGVVLFALVALFTSVLLFRSPHTTVRAEAADTPAEDGSTKPPAAPEPGQPPASTANRTVSGNAPGLYGGTKTNICDAAMIERYLSDHPKMAEAWAKAQGPSVTPDQIHDFLASLTPVTLLSDTAVTNNDYRDGQAVPFQSVLQAGTAVLIDERGVPRVRCACGNPLGRPGPRPSPRYEYEGRKWLRFDDKAVTVIRPARESLNTFVLMQPGGVVVDRPPGHVGETAPLPPPAEKAAAQQPHQHPGPPVPRPTPGSPPGPAGTGT